MEFKTGDVVRFGNYHGPVEWKVLDTKEDDVLIITKDGIDTTVYEKDFKFATWETCDIRKWLNKEFLNEAFSEKEKSLINITDVEPGENPDYRVDAGGKTKDRAFLLSADEACKYFADDAARSSEGTAFAKERGLYIDYNGKSRWWLRTPGYTDYRASFVQACGFIDTYGLSVWINQGTLRPAMWVKAEALA